MLALVIGASGGCGDYSSSNTIVIGHDTNASASADATVVLGPFFTGASPEKRPVASHTFVIENKGKEDVSLKVASKSCGCTTVHLGDGSVPTGGQVQVRVDVDLPNASRREVQTIVLNTSSGHPREIFLTVDCYAYARLGIFPLDAARVRVSPKQPAEVKSKIALYQPDAEARAQPVAGVRGEWLTVRLDNVESRLLAGGIRETTADLVATVTVPGDAAAHSGLREGIVTVSTADGEAVSRKIIWSPELPIRSIPERLLVYPSATGARSSVRLRSVEPFVITRVEADVPWLIPMVKSDTENCEQLIELETRPAELTSAARGVVTAYCEHPAQKVVHIPVVGLLRESSRLPQ